MTKSRYEVSVLARSILFALGLVVLLNAAGRAAEDDPIKAKLDKAKAVYDDRTDKLRAALLKSLDDKEDAARKASNKKLVDQIKAERDAFDLRGELPKIVPTANYLRDGKQAWAALEAAYTTAIKEFTRAKQDDEAAAAEKDLKALKEALAGASLSALLTKDSIWTGVRRATTAKGKQAEDEFELKITARDGKDFMGEIVIDKTRKYDVDGTVVGDRIAFETEKKGKFKHTFEGRFRGGILELALAGTGQGGEKVKGAVVLTPPKGK